MPHLLRSTPGPRSAPLQLLRIRDFRQVWFAGALSSTMRWLDILAIGIYVLEVTSSAQMVAFMVFLRMAPMFLFGAVVGSLAGKLDWRKMLLSGLIILSVINATLSWLAWMQIIQLWHIGIGAVAAGLFWTLELPLRRMMITDVAGMDRIGAAMGLDTSTNNFTRMIGPFLGGFLYATMGLPGTMMMGFALYGLAAILLLSMKYKNLIARKMPTSILKNLGEGLSFARGNRTVSATLVITIILNMFGFSFLSMIPVIAREQLGLSPFPTGILMSAEGCGAFVSAIIIAFYVVPKRFNQMFFGGSCIYLVCIIAFATSPYFTSSIAMLWLAGFGISGFSAMQSAILISNSPAEMRPRIMGLLSMCIGSAPIGVMITGTIADHYSAATAVQIMATTGLIALTTTSLIWPEMRKVQKV